MLRYLFLIALLLTSWLWMQILHELGHVLGGWATGGEVERVILQPLAISRTDVQGSRQPLVVIWAGPIAGCLLPMLLWTIATVAKWSGAFLLRFFAGFCLLANGLYLAAGSFDGVGDCGDLLRHGAPIWTLWLFGVFTIPVGFYLLHNQGQHFGLGRRAKTISPAFSYGVILFAAVTLLFECLCSST
ncbi:M50 family metallopeptidase [Anatilimnocola floriformis]|uniref:M50 family metallopeptidase n=1 Tax=Anatilimnocola floriformis TaxID=2948575 RepID=UPI0020C25059|nr:M50 family metallopeptidase [Anatilimnocola floriformis]